MYEVKDTQQSMEDVMCSNGCECKVEDKPVMEQAVEKVVDEEPVDAMDEKTDEMVYDAQGGMSKNFLGGMFSGGGISPFNETNTLQFAVSIVIVILTGSLGLFGLLGIFSINTPTGKQWKSMAMVQILLLFGLTLVYSFDKNENDLYNILKLVSVALLCIVVFFKSLYVSESKSDCKYMSVGILVLISLIVLVMNVGMFNDIGIEGLKLDDNKELITRIISTILFVALWGTKFYCVFGDDTYCISDIEFTAENIKISPPAPLTGGKKKKQKKHKSK